MLKSFLGATVLGRSLAGLLAAFLYFGCQSAYGQEKKIGLDLAAGFPFGFYSVGHGAGDPQGCAAIIDGMRKAGVTYLGPYYGSDFTPRKRACFAAADKAGLKIVYYISFADKKTGKSLSFRHEAESQARSEVDEVDINAGVMDAVRMVAETPYLKRSVALWGVTPEEIRYWRSREFNYLKRITAAIRQAENKLGLSARPIMLYEASNRTEKTLLETGKFLDVQSIGTLSRSSKEEDVLKTIAKNTATLRETSEKIGTYPMVTLALYRDFPPLYHKKDIIDVVRRNSYYALLNGAKGILIWSWATRKGLGEQGRNDQVEGYLSVARDLNGSTQLGNVFIRGTVDDRLSEENGVATQIRSFQGRNYLFAINLTSESRSLPARIAKRLGGGSQIVGEQSGNSTLGPRAVGVWML